MCIWFVSGVFAAWFVSVAVVVVVVVWCFVGLGLIVVWWLDWCCCVCVLESLLADLFIGLCADGIAVTGVAGVLHSFGFGWGGLGDAIDIFGLLF